jgi:Zn-finger nucleic acid-binding protein
LSLAGCETCRGVWIDRKALEKISKPDPKARKFGAARGSRGAKQNLKCPICYHWMEAKNFENCPELEVDVCNRHGTWLDAGELQTVLMFAKGKKAAPHPSPLPRGEGEEKGAKMAPVTAGVVAASGALRASNVSEKNRSGGGEGVEIVFDLLEFVGEVAGNIDLGSIGDIGEVAAGVAEIGFGVLGGLG